MYIDLWEAGYEMEIEYPDGKKTTTSIYTVSSKADCDEWIKEAICHGAPSSIRATRKIDSPTRRELTPTWTPRCYNWEF